MRFSRRTAVAVIGAVALLAPAACGSGGGGGGASSKNVEVFTWWADGGEKAGLDGLVSVFDTACSGYKFVNGAVAGGAARTPRGAGVRGCSRADPPDTFQAHAGAELSDYINAGQVEDLSSEYKEWGLTSAFPKGLLDNLTVDGKIYSVPANIHRANVRVGQQDGAEPTPASPRTPTTMAEFFADLDKLKAKGVHAAGRSARTGPRRCCSRRC